MAELAGEIMHRAATRAEQKSLAGSVLAQHTAGISHRTIKRVLRQGKKHLAAGNIDGVQQVLDNLEGMLVPPRAK